MAMLRNCDVCSEKYGVGDPRNWHEPEHWPAECMAHYHKRKGEERIGLQIMKDIEPYKAVGMTGKPIIGSRKQHRDEMRARGLVEIGNEKITQKPYEPQGIAQDIARAWHESEH